MEAYYSMAFRAMPIGRRATNNINSFFSFSSSKPIIFLNHQATSNRNRFASLRSNCSTTNATTHAHVHPIQVKEEFQINSRSFSFQNGISGSANGAAIMAMGNAEVLSSVHANPKATTTASSTTNEHANPMLLNAEYHENYIERDSDDVLEYYTKFLRPEISNVIDRAIRPLFPAGFDYDRHDISIKLNATITPSSYGNHQDPIVMAANATSAALMLSDLPWGGPVGVVRIGKKMGDFNYTVNPSIYELAECDFIMVYACTQHKTLMIDVQAKNMLDSCLEKALRLAHAEALKYIEPQVRLAAKAGIQKNKDYILSIVSDLHCRELMIKNAIRRKIIEEGIRDDWRRLDEVRPIHCDIGHLLSKSKNSIKSKCPGSSIFQLGNDIVQCNVKPGFDNRETDSFGFPKRQGYKFPPFSINEIVHNNQQEKVLRHGNSSTNFVRKAFLAVLPDADEFPYPVGVKAECLMGSSSSDNNVGSSSISGTSSSAANATVCGVSLALMDAGIHLWGHVASVSMGVVYQVDPSTGKIMYKILTDISEGFEDHLGVGEMDLKIAGTRHEVTAVQLDLNPYGAGAKAGIPLDIICQCFQPASKARDQIISRMNRQISLPRNDPYGHNDWDWHFNWKFPVVSELNCGWGRKDAFQQWVMETNDEDHPIRKIEEETGAQICARYCARFVKKGKYLVILAKNDASLKKAQDMVKEFMNDKHMPDWEFRRVSSDPVDSDYEVDYASHDDYDLEEDYDHYNNDDDYDDSDESNTTN